MTERRLPRALGSTGTSADAEENDIIQKGANGIWYTRGVTEVVLPIVDTALDARTATDLVYTPGVPANWADPDPTEVAGALDDLASRTATKVLYAPGVPSSWTDPPADVGAALDGLATIVAPLNLSLAISMREIASPVTNGRALALGASTSPGFIRVFTDAPMYPLTAEGTLEAAGPLIFFKAVAQAGVDLAARIAGVRDSTSPLSYSDDAGASWTTVTAANSFGGNPGLDISHNNTQWLAICQTTTNAIFSSPTAAAASWTSRSLNGVAGDQPKRLCSSKTSGRSLCLGVNTGTSTTFMAQSADGIAWTQTALPAGSTTGSATSFGSLTWDPRGYFWLAAVRNTGGVRLYRSPDTGAVNWTFVYFSVVSSLEVAVDPMTGLVYLVGDGRLQVSDDLGVTFHALNSSIDSVVAVNGLLFGLNTTTQKLYQSIPSRVFV
jgi:hypothetical protein